MLYAATSISLRDSHGMLSGIRPGSGPAGSGARQAEQREDPSARAAAFLSEEDLVLSTGYNALTYT